MRQSAAKRLSNGERSTTIPKGSTEVNNLGKQPVYLRKRNVIYCITNVVNGKIYIGSASYYDKRMGTHIYWLRRNDHDNKYLQSAYNKYGDQSLVFSILEEVDCKENLLLREQYWLDLKQSYNRKIGYNLCKKAESRIGQSMSEEAKKKIGAFWKGKKFSKERVKSLIERTTKNQGKAVVAFDGKTNIIIDEYLSISAASRALGVSIAMVSLQCKYKKGLIKPRKYLFRYKDIV